MLFSFWFGLEICDSLVWWDWMHLSLSMSVFVPHIFCTLILLIFGGLFLSFSMDIGWFLANSKSQCLLVVLILQHYNILATDIIHYSHEKWLWRALLCKQSIQNPFLHFFFCDKKYAFTNLLQDIANKTR